MKHLKIFENFNPYDDDPLTNTEKIFGKQTRLEKQFSQIVVNGLINNTRYWSTFKALLIEIKEIVDERMYKELQHRVVEGENTTDVINDICFRIENKNSEMKRLIEKLNSL
jgi:hypothetical protein